MCRRLPFLVVCCLGLATLNCRTDSPNRDRSEQLPFAGIDVRIALPAGGQLLESWAAAFEEWTAATGASYSVTELDYGAASWHEGLEGDTAPFLLLMPHRLIPELAADERIAAIPAELRTSAKLAWSELSPGVRDRLTSLGGEPSVLPVTCESLVCYFRADLLERAGLAVPQTWEQYEALRSSRAEWAPGLVAVEPWGAEFRSTMFLARAVAGAKNAGHYSLELDVSTGVPLIAGPPFVKALAEFREGPGSSASDCLGHSPLDCRREMLEGRAAMGVGYEPVARDSTAAVPLQRDAAVRLVCAPLPGRAEVFNRDTVSWETPDDRTINRPALVGFEGLSVCVLSSATSRQVAAAWDLWGTLQSYQQDGTIAPLPGTPCRPSWLNSSPQAPNSDLTPEEWASYQQSVTANLANPLLVVELPCLGRHELLERLSQTLGEGLSGDAASSAILEAAAGQWKEAIEALGRQRVLNSYRISLGLTPLR